MFNNQERPGPEEDNHSVKSIPSDFALYFRNNQSLKLIFFSYNYCPSSPVQPYIRDASFSLSLLQVRCPARSVQCEVQSYWYVCSV